MFPLLFTVFIVLFVSLVVSELLHVFGVPRVVGQIFSGMILGIPLIGSILFSSESLAVIEFLGELGLIFLLLLTGLEMDLRKIKGFSRTIVSIALFGALVPFALGVIFIEMAFMLGLLPLGEGLNVHLVAFVVGTGMALTSEATKAKALMEMNALKTKIGGIMISAGAGDDIFEVVFLAIVLFLAGQSMGTGVFFNPIFVIAIFAGLFFIIKILPRVFDYFSKEKSEESIFAITVVAGLGIAVLFSDLGLGPIIGAFITGILINVSVERETEQKLARYLKVLTFALIIPFFFVLIGMNFDFSIVTSSFGFVALIVFIAWLGKVLGVFIGAARSNFSKAQKWLMGWGMNSRGAVELVIIKVAFNAKIIDSMIFSAIVAMAIFSTLVFPFALKYYLKKYPGIMEQ